MDEIRLGINYSNLVVGSYHYNYKAINNKIYIINNDDIDVHIYIIEDFILTYKYIKEGVRAIINDNILYIVDKKLNLYKYNINNFELIEIIKNKIYIKYYYDNIELVYCDKPYLINYTNNKIDKHNNKYIIIDIYDNIEFQVFNKKVEYISYDKENIYIIDRENYFDVFNVKTKIINNNKIEHNISIYQLNNTIFSAFIDNKQYIYDIEKNKINEFRRGKDFCEEIYYYNIKNNIYLMNAKLYVLTKPTISSFNNNEKMAKLGNSYIPLNLLINRCKVIQLMVCDLSENNEIIEIENKLFKNIDIYIEYIKTNKIDINNTCADVELFKIMNFLEDTDVEHIASYLAKNANLDNNIYNKLDLLYNSPYTLQFIYLVEKILKYKHFTEIIENLKNKSCYKYLLEYNLIKYNNIDKKLV